MFEIKINESGFRYIEMFGGPHNCKRIRVYFKSVCQLPEEQMNGSCFMFPLISFKIITSSKGTFIIVPDERFVIHYISITSGYRGWAEIHPGMLQNTNERIIQWEEYHSPAGNLGCTANLILSTNENRTVTWHRSGRRVEGLDKQGEILLRVNGQQLDYNDPELD